MKEKKLRTLLIVLAVLLSGALCFASMGLTDSVMKLYEENAKASIGNAQIKIVANDQSPSEYVSMGPSRQLSERLAYSIPTINASAYYQKEQGTYEELSLMGIALDDYKAMNTLELVRTGKSQVFEGNCIIISEKTAEKYNLQVGDNLEIRLRDKRKRYSVYGIASSVGIFKNEGNRPLLMLPYETLSSSLGTNNCPTTLYIKAKEGEEVKTLVEDLKKLYPKYEVGEAIDLESFRDVMSSFSTMLVMMAVIITMMSIFIVYSSFKVIMLEKMPVVGTFRSVGASKGVMGGVLLLEGSFYGILGGLLATGAGIGILKLVVTAMMGVVEGSASQGGIVLKPSYFIGTFLVCVGICIFSSLFPILKMSKIPIKEIVLGGDGKPKKKKRWKEVMALLLVFFSTAVIGFLPEDAAPMLGSLGMLLGMIGIIGILPLVVKWTCVGVEKLFSLLFGNIGLLAVKNVKGNKSIRNSMTLIVIGVGILLMINNFGENLAVEVVSAYHKTFDYSLEIRMDQMDKSDVRALYYEEGVQEAYGMFRGGLFEGTKALLVDYGNAPLMGVEGVQGEQHGEYVTYDYASEEEKREILSSLEEGRNIAVSHILRKRYNLQMGQLLRIEVPEGIRTYKVIGFFDTMMNNGSIAQIGGNYFRQDYATNSYACIYLKTKGDPEVILEHLKGEYRDRHLHGQSLKTQIKENEESNASVITALSALSMLAILIGIVGIVNNLFISFIERKRSIAVFRSVGMSKKQVLQMIFLEALYTGLMGSAIGISMGWMLMKNLPYALELMQLPPIAYFVGEGLGMYVVIATLVTVVASISPAFKSSKLNIIEAIKFE